MDQDASGTLEDNSIDITECRRAEEKLRQHDHVLQAIFENDPGALAVLSGTDLTFQFVNPVYRTLLPDPHIDPVGHRFREIWPVEEGFQILPFYQRVLEKGESIHTSWHKQKYPRGAARYFSLHLLPITWEDCPAVLSVMWETTSLVYAKKRAEQAAQEAQQTAEELKQVQLELE